jgi:hypothetical protein
MDLKREVGDDLYGSDYYIQPSYRAGSGSMPGQSVLARYVACSKFWGSRTKASNNTIETFTAPLIMVLRFLKDLMSSELRMGNSVNGITWSGIGLRTTVWDESSDVRNQNTNMTSSIKTFCVWNKPDIPPWFSVKLLCSSFHPSAAASSGSAIYRRADIMNGAPDYF